MLKLDQGAAGRTRRPPIKRSPRPRWQILLGLLMSAGIVALVVVNQAWLRDALNLARAAQPLWLVAALAVILTSYLVSGQVLRVTLRLLGHRFGTLRAWITALVAILISQSVPAGGVGGYAFLVSAFKRRGVASGPAALAATLEALSYAGAMILIAVFSLIYLAIHTLATGAAGAPILVPLLVGLGVAAAIAGAAVASTQSETMLAGRLLVVQRVAKRLLGRSWSDGWASEMAAKVAHGRALIVGHRRMLGLLVCIQLIALCGHSLAMLLILLSLGVHTGFAVVLAAFGAALVTSLFNVLPGGGGTIETILAAVLGFLAVGPAAIPAAIIFRLLNFWLLLPAAAAGYALLMRERRLERIDKAPCL
jgi:uncharacterized protein (TIRG00374 family)